MEKSEYPLCLRTSGVIARLGVLRKYISDDCQGSYSCGKDGALSAVDETLEILYEHLNIIKNQYHCYDCETCKHYPTRFFDDGRIYKKYVVCKDRDGQMFHFIK